MCVCVCVRVYVCAHVRVHAINFIQMIFVQNPSQIECRFSFDQQPQRSSCHKL